MGEKHTQSKRGDSRTEVRSRGVRFDRRAAIKAAVGVGVGISLGSVTAAGEWTATRVRSNELHTLMLAANGPLD